MRGIKIPQYEFALKMQGGAYARGGAYLRDTMVYVMQSDWKKGNMCPPDPPLKLPVGVEMFVTGTVAICECCGVMFREL